jgi:folate-binding protein YgfZ
LIRKSCHLSDRAVIAVSGPEAHAFLQGLVTNDVAKLPQQPLYAALLSPQGKILFDFLLFAEGDTVLIDVQKEQRPALVKRLSMYKLRAKVEIAPRNDRIVVADDGPADPRLAALGQRSIVPADIETVDGADAYHDWRWGLGVPEAADFGSEKIFAMDGGLDELNAISFTKGCYVGQELTARMKHRGTDRKRLLPVSAPDAELETGSPVVAGGIEIGTVMSSYGDAGFALIRLDRLAEASEPIAVAGAEVAIVKPEWLFT